MVTNVVKSPVYFTLLKGSYFKATIMSYLLYRLTSWAQASSTVSVPPGSQGGLKGGQTPITTITA